ncbi:MAG: RNA-binding cell elongation regulator Jag/EloR [Acidimicrobiales bacterium]
MEWVEIIAPTLDEARDEALDQLGVDDQDAEIEVLEEPRAGLFGRVRGQARVRARVAPTRPRPKAERRDRRKKKPEEGAPEAGAPGGAVAVDAEPVADDATGGGRTVATAEDAASPAPRRRPDRRGAGRPERHPDRRDDDTNGGTPVQDLTIDQQAEVVATFLTGLTERFGVPAATETVAIEEGVVEIAVQGSATELGLLIGPKGATLQAVQELARTVVQRQGGGTQEGRVRIDIAGYRQRRREALERFTQQVAEQVLASGESKALEAMHPADRKVVHDTANTIAGVHTISEGEEPRRRVVILPDAD